MQIGVEGSDEGEIGEREGGSGEREGGSGEVVKGEERERAPLILCIVKTINSTFL